MPARANNTFQSPANRYLEYSAEDIQMRKHVLFFVHGMGSYVNASGTPNHSWSKAAVKALKEQYNQYAMLKLAPSIGTVTQATTLE